MIRKSGMVILASLLYAFGAVQNASAAPIFWEFNDVYFESGGEASGYFIYDAETNILNDYSVYTTGWDVNGASSRHYNSELPEHIATMTDDKNLLMTFEYTHFYAPYGIGLYSYTLSINLLSVLPSELSYENQLVYLDYWAEGKEEHEFIKMLTYEYEKKPPTQYPQLRNIQEGGWTVGEPSSYVGPYIKGSSPAPVPEPATILFLGAGLISLIGFRKKFPRYARVTH